MSSHGGEGPRRLSLDRLFSWFAYEDDEATPQVAYQTLEDEYLY